MIEGFVGKLMSELNKPLPGLKAQLKMSPNVTRIAEKYITPPNDARKSGVLILLYQDSNQDIRFPLIKRSSYDGAHSGQISLPGGKVENTETYKQTALREAQEEIGIESNDVRVLGELTRFYVWVSNYIVQPVVGYLDYAPRFIPDLYEVESVIPASISDFLDDQRIKRKKISTSQGYVIDAPYYNIEGEVVWGATAMMLSEFREVLKKL